MATVAIQLGIALAGAVLNAVFAPTPPPQEGPRLNDLNLPAVNPGNPVNRLYGTMALGTQLIWTTGLKETRHEKKVKGGKGGGKAQKQITYTYSTDVACVVCEGTVDQVRRIWANNKILFQGIIYTGDDAIAAVAAAQIAASLSASMNDSRDETDGEAKAKAKRHLVALLTTLSSGMVSLTTTLTDLGESTVFLTDPYDDFVEWATDTVHCYTPGTTTYDKSAGLTIIDEYIGALDTAEQMLREGAIGTENAYLNGVSELFLEDKAAELGYDLDELEPEGRAAFVKSIVDKKGLIKEDEDKKYDRLNIYNGTRTQMPDDIIEADKGVGNVPAYRGVCYFVCDELQLADYGNTLPTFRVEVAKGDINGQTSLVTIVNDLCERAGLEDTDFNTGGMSDKPLDGFAVTRTSSARELMEILRNVYHFDAVEKDYKVCFIDRYTQTRARLRRQDFAAVEFDSDPIADVETTRGQVSEFPREINFTYQDPGRDYSVGTARARRSIQSIANGVENIELPMALTPELAKTAVDRLMTYRWSMRRSYKIVVPIKYNILDPGDAVLIPDRSEPNKDTRHRIESMSIGANHLIEMVLVDQVVPRDDITGIAYVQPQLADTKKFAGTLVATLLDVPILSDTEDATVPGIYVTFSSPGNNWPGGSLYFDSGSGGTIPTPGGSSSGSSAVSWELAAVSGYNTPLLQLVDDFPAASPYVWDRTSVVRVAVQSYGYAPSSVPESTLLRGTTNTLIVNGEICQFATVTDLGDDIYELRDFIRGQRGTESFVQNHPKITSEVIVLMSEGVQRVDHSVAQLNTAVDYVAANANQDIQSLTPFDFTDTGNSLRPYAPCHVRRDDDPSGDITLSWQPRVRQAGTWADSADPALDQETEKYEIDVYDGATFKRTLAVDGAREVVYTSAMQTTDFGGPPALGAMTIRAYQIGAIIGRGFTNPINL